jgi:hypothetical protein
MFQCRCFGGSVRRFHASVLRGGGRFISHSSWFSVLEYTWVTYIMPQHIMPQQWRIRFMF